MTSLLDVFQYLVLSSTQAGVWLFAWVYLFWLLYLVVMGVYRAHLSKRLQPVALALLLPVVLLGVIVDVLSNIFIAPFIFLDLPKELLVTTRLTRYKKMKDGWRKKIAEYICFNLLDVFDPSENHCN